MFACSNEEGTLKAAFEEQALTIRNLESRLAKVEQQLRVHGATTERTMGRPMDVDDHEATPSEEPTDEDGLKLENTTEEHPSNRPSLDNGFANSSRLTLTEGCDGMPEEANDPDEPSSMYSFSMSMWDVAMLLAFRGVKLSDKVIIIIGVIINLGMQMILLAVVYFDMVGNDFDDQRVQNLISWRVNQGHDNENINKKTGDTLLQQLCNQSLWSFEQAEYTEMFDYLYQPMPGWSLSILAITLWVLTISVEFRGVYEQTMAMLTLPIHFSVGAAGMVKTEDGFEIHAIRRSRKVVIGVFLIFPRIFMVVALAIVGCWYLAQTVSLSDIVLNSLALAFVMEVDELIAEVLLPRKLRETVEQVQPISCGKPIQVGPLYFADVLRYVFMLALITFSCQYWLWPFHGHVEAAAMALCAGNKAFTQTGGTVQYPTIVLLDNVDYISECGDGYFKSTYVPKYYLGAGQGQHNTNSPKSDNRSITTLQYAFSACSNGEAWLHMDNEKQGKCVSVTKHLSSNMPRGVALGNNPLPSQCERFEPKLGDGTCKFTGNQASCAWTSQAYQCESYPPGKLDSEACGADLSVYETLQTSCNIWESTFKMPHPTANCLIVEHCTLPSTDCLHMASQLDLVIGNISSYGTNDTVIQDAITSGLATALNVSNTTVYILQIRGFSYNSDALTSLRGSDAPPGRRLQEVVNFLSSKWQNTDAVVDNNSISEIKFVITKMPVNLIPSTFPERIAKLVSQINSRLGNGTVTSANFSSSPIYASSDQVQTIAAQVAESQKSAGTNQGGQVGGGQGSGNGGGPQGGASGSSSNSTTSHGPGPGGGGGGGPR